MEKLIRDYLGDSVYAEWDGWAIKLYTNNGCGPQNIIYVDPDVFDALLRFKKRIDLIKADLKGKADAK